MFSIISMFQNIQSCCHGGSKGKVKEICVQHLDELHQVNVFALNQKENKYYYYTSRFPKPAM